MQRRKVDAVSKGVHAVGEAIEPAASAGQAGSSPSSGIPSLMRRCQAVPA